MEERDEADESEGDRLPLFYTSSGDKQIEYLPFTEAKAISSSSASTTAPSASMLTALARSTGMSLGCRGCASFF
jgi:hypothetical protein